MFLYVDVISIYSTRNLYSHEIEDNVTKRARLSSDPSNSLAKKNPFFGDGKIM